MKSRLDDIDWQILRELQTEGRITNVELARRVGITAPPCLRRVRALEEAGIIQGYRAILDGGSLGWDVTAFAHVMLNSQAEADLIDFEREMQQWALVRECYMMSGEVDFVLKCLATNLAAFQSFIIELTGATNVKSVKTMLSIRQSKNEPVVPLGDAAPIRS